MNDTINANYAISGGGIVAAGGNVTVQNTISAGNFVSNSAPDLIALNNGRFVGGSGNVIGSDPLLGPLQNNGGPTVGAPGTSFVLETEALLPGSLALDKATVAGARPPMLAASPAPMAVPPNCQTSGRLNSRTPR